METSGSEMSEQVVDGPSWPLSRERQELVVMLGEMVRRFGTERFLVTPLVRADAKDFPDAWEPTLHGIYLTLNRLCWLAYLDPEIVVHDHRSAQPSQKMLRKTEIEIASCNAGVVAFDLVSIGNDDVAGLLSHKVGQAYLELVSGEPFRSAKHESSDVEGSVAAYFLGLGVLAANSSMYRRHRAVVRGRSEYSEQEITTDGGLGIAEATMLLAIQDILRDDVQDAHETLHKPQREWLDEWKDALDRHEDELREMLGLDDAPDVAPVSRADAPRSSPTTDEEAHKRVNAGRETKRLKRWSYAGVFGGMVLGGVAFLGGPIVGIAGVVVGTGAAWWRWCGAYYTCVGAGCGKLLEASDAVCPGCGGKITKTLNTRELAELHEQWRAEEEARDEARDPSEFAGDPDEGVISERRPRARRRALPPGESSTPL
ncbi:MAG TPA: hypothetical protein VGM39_04075 [Kofleriaceae bacterium]